MQEELQTQMKDEIQTVHARLDRFEERLQLPGTTQDRWLLSAVAGWGVGV